MIIFLLFALLFIHPTKIYAETDRITVTPQVITAKVSTQIPILIKVLDDTTVGAKPSQGEEVEIRLAQPSDSIICLTENGRGPSDANGEIHASCNATKSGTYTIYAFSYGRGDQSKNVNLTYTDTDPAASSAAAMSQQMQQKAQTQNAAATTDNGLVEETLAPTPFLNGVSSMNGQVAAAAVSAAREQQKNADDADLLKTLIFITGAVILIIWSVYLIILQHSHSRKKNNPSNFTPL